MLRPCPFLKSGWRRGRRGLSTMACVLVFVGFGCASVAGPRSGAAVTPRHSARVLLTDLFTATSKPHSDTSEQSLSALVAQPTIPAAQFPVVFSSLNKLTCSASGDCLAVGEMRVVPEQPTSAHRRRRRRWRVVNSRASLAAGRRPKPAARRRLYPFVLESG